MCVACRHMLTTPLIDIPDHSHCFLCAWSSSYTSESHYLHFTDQLHIIQLKFRTIKLFRRTTHNNFIYFRKHVWMTKPTCHRRDRHQSGGSCLMITRGCYGNLGPLSVAHTYNTRTPISTIHNNIHRPIATQQKFPWFMRWRESRRQHWSVCVHWHEIKLLKQGFWGVFWNDYIVVCMRVNLPIVYVYHTTRPSLPISAR